MKTRLLMASALLLLCTVRRSEALDHLSCDFEGDNLCGLINDQDTDQFDWTFMSGSTESKFTGPDVDHTTGSFPGVYMYIEVTDPRGHASMVAELKEALSEKPGCIIASVGGGGLLTGIIAGLDMVGWTDVPLIAAETEGAASFAACMTANQIIKIPDITSIATSLGSRTICEQLFLYSKNHSVHSVVVSDKEAVQACLKFSEDHRLLVEPACGASLAVLYSGHLARLQQGGQLPAHLSSIVVIVCGGNSVSVDTLYNLRNSFGIKS